MIAADPAQGVENREICSKCGGNCCQQYAGIAWPSDFGTTRIEMVRNIAHALGTGFWAIDTWDGDPRPERRELGRVDFIRPAHTNATGKMVDYSWGGTCRLWCHGYGCSLRLAERPTQCRVVVPRKGGGCDLPEEFSKQAAAIAWIPFEDVIDRALKRAEPAAITSGGAA